MNKTRTETYSVTKIRDPKTNEITFEEWTDQATGELHNPDGPAQTWIEEVDGRLRKFTCYFRQGKSHRDGDEPAYTVTDIETGIDIIRQWRRFDEWHRDEENQPCGLWTDLESGVANVELYAINGSFHRTDGPACIYRASETGEVTEAIFYNNGVEISRDPTNDPTP
jgi:hypothetical protein